MPGRTMPLFNRAAPTAAGQNRSPAAMPPVSSRPARRATALLSLVAFVVTLSEMLLHNRQLFTVGIHEVGDTAADSLLVDDAKHFHLLVGHYSRVGFNHPGPAALYLKAAGEWLFTDVLGWTPAPYNGQLLAVLILEAAVITAVVGVVQAWTGRWPAAIATLVALLVWYGSHPWSLTSTWMPLFAVAPFLLLMVASASVASGRHAHLWLLAATAGLLVHSHVAFVLFAPTLVLAAVATWMLTERLGLRALWRRCPRDWAAAAAITALFVAPIALNTLLHWPGEIPKYVAYSSGAPRVSPTVGEAIVYARTFWTPYAGTVGDAVVLALFAAALAAGWSAPRHLRRPLLALTSAAALAEGLFVLYAKVGIDDLKQAYVGYFSWSVPIALIVVVTVALTAGVRVTGIPATALLVLAVLVLGLASGSHRFDPRPEGEATLPVTVHAVESAAAEPAVRTPLLLDIGPGLGPFIAGTGLLLNLERDGIGACVSDPAFRVQVTTRRICSAGELRTGRLVTLRVAGSSAAATVHDAFSDITVLP